MGYRQNYGVEIHFKNGGLRSISSANDAEQNQLPE